MTPDPTRALKVYVCGMIGCDAVDVNKRSVVKTKILVLHTFCLHLGICYGSLNTT